MRIIIFTIAIAFFCQFESQAQKNNNVYITAGTFVFLQNVNINYETSLKSWDSGNRLYLKAQVGWAGALPDPDDEERGFVDNFVSGLGVVYLYKTGTNGNIDFGLGGLMIIREDFARPFPNLTLGYRKQSKSTVLRVGIGIPEGLYFSYGVRF